MQPLIAVLMMSISLNNAGSVNGKYVNLLYTISMPEDKASYGAYCEWGYWAGDSYGTETGLKPGFWVYVYPNWYVWEKLSAENDVDTRAYVKDKYRVLLHVFSVPGDAGSYGQIYDYGFAECYSYAGHENLTPGYWVYVQPNWYVWAEVNENVFAGST
ncbi:MAG TPA: hypothetical protein VF399_08695 [bacterium]